jgi:hypothetical protein
MTRLVIDETALPAIPSGTPNPMSADLDHQPGPTPTAKGRHLMLRLIEPITPNTLCPNILGGTVGHYPRTIDGTPITMPGPVAHGLGEPTVMLALCGDAYLGPPRVRQHEALAPCSGCVYARHTLTLVPDTAPDAGPDTMLDARSAPPADDHTEWPSLRLVPRVVAG